MKNWKKIMEEARQRAKQARQDARQRAQAASGVLANQKT